MSRTVVALGLALLAGLAPTNGWAQQATSGMRPDSLGTVRRPSHRPRPPFVHRPIPVIPCCLGFSYGAAEPPPVIVPALPSVIYVVSAPPPLAYVATPRPEPAAEVQLPTGRWERHGNAKEYPYTWVWVGAAPAR
jgi:hypothetical protein